jgi:hypothetical protein
VSSDAPRHRRSSERDGAIGDRPRSPRHRDGDRHEAAIRRLVGLVEGRHLTPHVTSHAMITDLDIPELRNHADVIDVPLSTDDTRPEASDGLRLQPMPLRASGARRPSRA